MKICNVIRGEPGKETAVNISQVMVVVILKGIPQWNLLLLTTTKKLPNVVCQRVNLQLQFIKFLVILPFTFQLSLHLERGTHHTY